MEEVFSFQQTRKETHQKTEASYQLSALVKKMLHAT